MVLLLVFLGACNGCQPDIPNPQDTEDPPDTDTALVDTSDSSPLVETGPPARCDREELEPNSPPSQTEMLEMELWSCGVFATYVDYDSFQITPTQAGWIRVQVDAASRGSSANPQLLIDGGGESATVLDGYLTTDPLLVFPADEVQSYTLTLGETNLLYGEDYTWFMLTSLVKTPVEWTIEEAEPNDEFGVAQPFAMGETVFSTISDASDFDWYKFTTPYEGEQTIQVEVTAFKEGSAADLVLTLYEADGTTFILEDNSGEITYDRDPYFRRKFTGVQDLYLLARTANGTGSRYHWYTLTISVTTE